MNISGGVSHSSRELPKAHDNVALTPHWSDPQRSRISIVLLAAQHMKGGFGQMPRHRAHCYVVSFAPCSRAYSSAHVPFRASADNSPPPNSPLPKTPTSDTDSRPAASVRTAPDLRWRAPAASFPHNWPVTPRSETALLADFQCDRGRQDHAHSRKTLQPLHLRRFLDQFFQAVFELSDLGCTRPIASASARRPEGLLRQSLHPPLSSARAFFP